MPPTKPAACRRHQLAVSLAAALALALTALPLGAGTAGAAEALVPGTNSWSLSHDTGDRYCLAHAFFPRSGIGLGFVSDGEALGVGLVHAEWSLSEWEEYDVAFRFDGVRGMTARFTATDATAMASELDPKAEEDFRRSGFVEILARNGKTIARLSLAGSAHAIDYVRTCGQIAAMRMSTPSSDH
jgi:hypothetical protein